MFAGIKTRLTTLAKAAFGEVTGTNIGGDKLAVDTIICGVSGNQLSINPENRADVVQHAHPSSVNYQFDHTFTTPGTFDFIIGDLSDTTNYKHTATGYFHLEWMHVEIDQSSNSTIEIQVGFLEDVTATDSTFYEIFHISASKTAGTQRDVGLPMYPNGPKMRSQNLVSSMVYTNDTGFQSDTALPTIIDPATADTLPGNGDMVIRVIFGGGTSSRVGMHGSYHSHE